MLSSKSKKIKKLIRSKDVRGSIVSIVEEKTNNISIINCNSKTIRSNHLHKKDWHFMYILKGLMEYFFINACCIIYKWSNTCG